MQRIFIADTSITTALWLSWKLPLADVPNNPQIFELKGYIQRRQGKQQEALQNLERAVDLDPRNVLTLQQIALVTSHLRRYAEAESAWIARWLSSGMTSTQKSRSRCVDFDWKADVRPLRRLMDSIRGHKSATPSKASPMLGFVWL